MYVNIYGPRNEINACIFPLWVAFDDRDLSVETIALILSLANVCAGGRYLVIDETGLIIAAILERGTSSS